MCLSRLLTKAKGFLFDPENAFKKEKKTSLLEAFKYFLFITAIYIILVEVILFLYVMKTGSIMTMEFWAFEAWGATFSYLISIGFSILIGVWIHIFVKILGTKQDYQQSIKLVFYSLTPGMVLGWIPLLGYVNRVPYIELIFIVWCTILMILGVRTIHSMKNDKAILSVILAILIGFVLMWGVLMLVSGFFVGVSPIIDTIIVG